MRQFVKVLVGTMLVLCIIPTFAQAREDVKGVSNIEFNDILESLVVERSGDNVEVYSNKYDLGDFDFSDEQEKLINDYSIDKAYNTDTFNTGWKARPRYYNESGTPVTRVFKGYLGGNNVPTKFSTGGGFYYSPDGGSKITLRISFNIGVLNASVDAGRIVSSGGIFVTAPNTKHYFRLYVEKKVKCTPYTTYYVNSKGKKSVYSKGVLTKVLNRNVYAKRV